MTAGIPTSAGIFRAEFTNNRLVALHFPSEGTKVAPSAESMVHELGRQLDEYFRGKRRRFEVEVDLSAGTEFQQRVWRAMARIPFGETQSYGEIARAIGNPRASRAVGAACGRNPIPVIIPCHRVLANHNRLGGFSGGLSWKRKLLALEGLPFEENGR